VPGPHEVRVRVRAAGLNHLDTWVRRGIPGVAFPLPLVPGCDGAGVVDAVGEGVSSRKSGDPVVLAPGLSCGLCRACASGEDPLCRHYGILGETRDGTCAEAIVVPERNALALPKGVSFEDAAAFPLVFLTAWHMVVARAALRPGETILVQAAGSGVSTAAIQIARLIGAGRATSGAKAEIPLNLVFFKSLSVLGSTMGSLGEMHELLGHLAAGRLKPVVDSVLPLSEVAQGHRRLESRDVFGKIVLRVP
jgi:NADPH:quinone reductase-like Zn-dependent oxidoreductase